MNEDVEYNPEPTPTSTDINISMLNMASGKTGLEPFKRCGEGENVCNCNNEMECGYKIN